MNIVGERHEKLNRFIEVIEKSLGNTATKKLIPMQPGEFYAPVADIKKLRKWGWKTPTLSE